MLGYLTASLCVGGYSVRSCGPRQNHASEEMAWIRFESLDDWHRFQELILPLSVEK
jgi:hypothetical protein